MSSLIESPSQDPLALSKTIVDSYVEHSRKNADLYDDYSSYKAITLSVIDLSKIPKLVSNLRDLDEHFFYNIDELVDSYSFAKIIRSTGRYGETGKASTGHLDLYHFAENIDTHLPEVRGSDTIKADVKEAVVYNLKGGHCSILG